jgi:hypothetical protein
MSYKKSGYIVYHSNVIPNYSFIPVILNTFDGNLYEKKIVCNKKIEVYFDDQKYILEEGTHYFPTFSTKTFITKHRVNEDIEVYQIYKPNELAVSKIYKEKQLLIDTYFANINHSKKIASLFTYYQIFIPTIKHTYRYLFSIYNDTITFTKYMTLSDDIKDSIQNQIYIKDYIEKRVNEIEYKGKREVILQDETIVENILTSVNNISILQDENIKDLILENSINTYDETSNFTKIKYYYKNHLFLRKYLKENYMVILRPPKYEQYVDVYEPYEPHILENMWKSHFDIIDSLEKEKHITFYVI